MNNQKIVDKFMSNVGLFSNIFGKYSDKMAQNQRKEKAKALLYHIYDYKDIFDTLPPEVDETKVVDIIKVLNQYYDRPEPSE